MILQLGLGLAWIVLLASQAPPEAKRGLSGPQVIQMLVFAAWLPSVAMACWQMTHRHWRSLIMSDLVATGVLVLLALTAYVPLFLFNVAWFLPFAILPRGLLTELLIRLGSRLVRPGS